MVYFLANFGLFFLTAYSLVSIHNIISKMQNYTMSIKNIVSSLGLDEAWWTNITVAAMICLFLVVQSVVLLRKNQSKQ